MLANSYARIKNLVRDEIPRLVPDPKLASKGFEKLNPQLLQTPDQLNQWTRGMLSQVIQRKSASPIASSEEACVYLFRLLTIRHFAGSPLLDATLLTILESRICNAIIGYALSHQPPQLGHQSHSRPELVGAKGQGQPVKNSLPRQGQAQIATV